MPVALIPFIALTLKYLVVRLLMALVVVMFSFGGTELIGITAGETEDPRRTIPRATNGIIWRILVFYIGALGVIMAALTHIPFVGLLAPSLAALAYIHFCLEALRRLRQGAVVAIVAGTEARK